VLDHTKEELINASKIGWIGLGPMRVQIYLYAAKSERDWYYDCS